MGTFEQKFLPGLGRDFDQINKELLCLKLASVPYDFLPDRPSQKETTNYRDLFLNTGRNLTCLLIQYLSVPENFIGEKPSWFESAALEDPAKILVTFANNYHAKGVFWPLCVAAVTSTIHQSASISEKQKETLIGKIQDLYLAIPTDFNVEDLKKIGLTNSVNASKLTDALREYFSLRDFSDNPRSASPVSPNKPK
jgi:hypothetical protein